MTIFKKKSALPSNVKKVKGKKFDISLLNVFLFLTLAFYVALIVILIGWGIFTSLKATDTMFNFYQYNLVGFPQGMPWEWAWRNYGEIFDKLWVKIPNGDEVGIITMLVNTLLYSVIGAVIATITPCFVAYACAKTKYKFNNVLIYIVIITASIPIVGSFISEVRILRSLGIYDTWFSALFQKMNFLGVYFLVFLGGFRGLSNTYAESAEIDGAGDYRVMFQIYIPLLKNIIFTVFLLKFVEFWNDFQYPLMFLESKPTLAYGVYALVHLSEVDPTLRAHLPYQLAGSVILFLPVFILFCFSRKILMQNINVGGIKE